MPRPALETPPDNKGRVDATNRALWAQHRKARDADVKAQRKAREEREAGRTLTLAQTLSLTLAQTLSLTSPSP